MALDGIGNDISNGIADRIGDDIGVGDESGSGNISCDSIRGGGDNLPISMLLKNATLEHFKFCVIPQLKAFCRVGLLPTETNAVVPQKKGTVEQARSGVKNLIFTAHSFCEREVTLSFLSDQLHCKEQDAFQPLVLRLTPNGEGEENFTFITAPFIFSVIDFTLPDNRTLELRTANRERICNDARLLTKILRKRLRYHLQERIQ